MKLLPRMGRHQYSNNANHAPMRNSHIGIEHTVSFSLKTSQIRIHNLIVCDAVTTLCWSFGRMTILVVLAPVKIAILYT